MAAVKTMTDMKLQVVTSRDDEGVVTEKTFTFSRIRGDATDDELLTAGTALGSLMADELSGVKLQEIYSLTEGV